MSLYKEGVYSVPGRVLALCDFLLGCPQMRERRTVCESALMPDDLLTGEDKRPMVRAVINESAKLGLIEKNDEDIQIAADALRILRAQKTDRRFWPLAFMDLLIQSEENHDMLFALAWWLSLPVLSAPGDWTTIDMSPKWRQDASNLGPMNDFRYTIFASWAVYLGFAWRQAKQQDRWLVPNPTKHVLTRLQAELGAKPREYEALEFVRKLADWCPVLDGGTFRKTAEGKGLCEPLEPTRLSSSLSLALLSLEEGGYLDLTHAADAEALLLHETMVAGRPQSQRVSGVRWLGKMENPA
jgi:hypothetical protein